MDSTPTTRFSLLTRLTDHRDDGAWAEFLELYQPVIYRFALSRGLQPVDATEVTQEVLVRVAKSIATFRKDPARAGFRRWLYTLTRNLTIDFLRKENRQAAVMEDLAWDQLPAPDPETAVAFELAYQRELFLTAARVIEPTVKPINWQAFWLTEVEREDVATTSHRLGLSRSAVYVARSRILKLFRQYIERNAIPDSESCDNGAPES